MALDGMDVEGGVIGIEGWRVVAWRRRSTRWLCGKDVRYERFYLG